MTSSRAFCYRTWTAEKSGPSGYPGQSPIEHTLKSFQIDITANPNMAELLNQLRGAKLTISMAGDNKLTGAILGVEKKLKTTERKKRSSRPPFCSISRLAVNFARSRSIRFSRWSWSIPSFKKNWMKRLRCWRRRTTNEKKPMTLHFNGQGERRVRIGYVVETPVWKTSYRLVLGDPVGQARKQGAGGGECEIGRRSKLQGWAIVDNQTDNDWTDVQLSLVSGSPLSFIQDLYHSIYIPRPVVERETYANLQPQTYGGGISRKRREVGGSRRRYKQRYPGKARRNGPAAEAVVGEEAIYFPAEHKEKAGPAMDPTSSVLSAASAADLATSFNTPLVMFR